jgi:integrase
MAYIHKHGDRWRVQINKAGLRRTKVFDTKREAQSWALEMEVTAKERATGWRTFAEAAKEYIKTKTQAKAGKDWEVRRIEGFVSHFGLKQLGELDSPDMARWRDSRLQTVTASTVVREANILKHILSTARDEWKWMDNDPWRGVKLPQENPPRHQRWTWKLILRVLKEGRRRAGKTREVIDAFHIAMRTGMRLQEVLAAPENFDPKRQVVRVKTKTAPKGEDIPVGRIATKLLQRPAFTVQPNEASVLFKKLTKQLLIDGLTFHDTRGSALTLMAKKVPVEVLAKVSRHRDISLLCRVYYRESVDDIAKRL